MIHFTILEADRKEPIKILFISLPESVLGVPVLKKDDIDMENSPFRQ